MDQRQREHLCADMARLAEGDRGAFEPVFAALWPPLSRFCRQFLGHPADGDDAAQEALMKIFSRAHHYDSDRDALTWAMGIAAYECRTIRKRSARRKEAALDAAAPQSGDDGADDILTAARLREALSEAMSALSAADTEVLCAAAGLIERPAVPQSTFRKRLQRARRRIRSIWGAA